MFRFAETAVWRMAVNELQDVADIVTQSAVCNKVEVVGWEDGIPLIPIHDWSSYSTVNMNKIIGIKKYQHFTLDSTVKGKVLSPKMQ